MNSCCATLQTHVRIEIDFGVFITWNRRLLTKYKHDNWHFCWFYFNMNKPAASKNRLKIHYWPIHQIDIQPAQIISSKSTISSKVLSERVLLSNHYCPVSNNKLSKYVLLSKRSAQYNNITIYLLQSSIDNLKKGVIIITCIIILMRTRCGNQFCVKYMQNKLSITGV